MMIRNVCLEDAAAIAHIYSYFVENTNITFETESPTPAEMAQRIRTYTVRFPYLVMEEDGKVIGYAYASSFKSRAAYSRTVELAIYFHHDYCGKGRGRLLLTALLDALKTYPHIYTAIACIYHPNPPSEKLFQSFGFQRIGIAPNVGYKNNTWLSTVDYVLPLRPYD